MVRFKDRTGRHAEAVMEDMYRDFLSTQEFEDLKRGVEIWLDYQINERLEKMFDAREARMIEEIEGYEPPPSIEDMMFEAAKKALAAHEAEKAKKEAKARKAAEKKPKANPFDGTNGNGYQPLPTGKTPVPPAEE